MIGGGRWGSTIKNVLSTTTEGVITFDISRRAENESRESYADNIKKCLQSEIDKVDVVWLAIPPVDQEIFVEIILGFHKHVIVEKPWMCDERITLKLIDYAKTVNKQVAVHYQYCYLDAFKHLPFRSGVPMGEVFFQGEFCISRENRLSIPAIYNMGSHLFAIKELFCPEASVSGINTGYNMRDKRLVRFESKDQHFEVDFYGNDEPLIQRFIQDFESHVSDSREFPLNLELSLSINRQLLAQ